MGTQPGYWVTEVVRTGVAVPGSLTQLSPTPLLRCMSSSLLLSNILFFFFFRQSMQGMNSYLI